MAVETLTMLAQSTSGEETKGSSGHRARYRRRPGDDRPGIGVGYIFGKVIEAVTRQPELRDEITSIQWLGFALTEAIVFYAFIFGLIAFFLSG